MKLPLSSLQVLQAIQMAHLPVGSMHSTELPLSRMAETQTKKLRPPGTKLTDLKPKPKPGRRPYPSLQPSFPFA